MPTDPKTAETPQRIWLLLHEGEGGSHVWCDDPDPTGSGDHETVGYVREDVVERLRASLREAATIARFGCLVPPDGGSPTQEEADMCERIAKAIEALEHR